MLEQLETRRRQHRGEKIVQMKRVRLTVNEEVSPGGGCRSQVGGEKYENRGGNPQRDQKIQGKKGKPSLDATKVLKNKTPEKEVLVQSGQGGSLRRMGRTGRGLSGERERDK